MAWSSLSVQVTEGTEGLLEVTQRSQDWNLRLLHLPVGAPGVSDRDPCSVGPARS